MTANLKVNEEEAIKDRIEKGFCRNDVFNMRDWLVTILPPMLEDIMREHECDEETLSGKYFATKYNVILQLRDAIRLLEASSYSEDCRYDIENACVLLAEAFPNLWF